MKNLWIIVSRECLRMKNDTHYSVCMFLLPIICIAFFTTLMKNGLPQKLPIGWVDQDNTPVTRQIGRNLDAFQQINLISSFPTVREARKAIQRGEIFGFYYIPQGTTRDINLQKQPTISYFSNMTYLVAGSLTGRDMRMMSELASGAASRKILFAKGKGIKESMSYLQPIIIDIHPIHNPWLNYNIYISNTVLPGILGLFIFLMTVYSIGMEIKKKTSKEWLFLANGKMLTALLGKLLPQTFCFFIMGAILDIFIYKLLGFPCYSGIPSMLFIMLIFILACQGLGVAMITLLPTLRLGLSCASLWGMLSFSISGMSYPVMAMDRPLQILSNLFPLRHYFLLYVNNALDGYSLYNCLGSLLSLASFALIPFICLPLLKRNLLLVKYIP